MKFARCSAKRCYECHGEKKQKGGLRADHIEHLKAGGDTGPALVPGKVDESLMIEAIRYGNEDLEMPPKKKLPDAEIAILEKWVAMGAPWPDTDKVVVVKGGFSDEQRKFWSFQPLSDPKPPKISADWVRNDIDRFILEKRSEQKLDAAPEADRRGVCASCLLRSSRSAADSRAGRRPLSRTRTRRHTSNSLTSCLRARVTVNAGRSIGSTSFVTRRAMDTIKDAYRPGAWPYRDWVIKALNTDMPYDQFVRQQLAGDEIDPKNPDVLVATGYLRNGIYEHNQRDVKGQWDLIVNDMT
jgi:hypothetical protein